MTNNTGKVGAVKKIMCCLLMVWLAVLSGGASAHAVQDTAHAAPAVHDHAAHLADHHADHHKFAGDPVSTAAATPDADHSEFCSQSHCGNSHTTALLTTYPAFITDWSPTTAPAAHAHWASSAMPSTIERPKWLFTTPAVVNLLS